MTIERHIGEQHVIRNADESIWVGFHGAVPRVNDIVNVKGHPTQRVTKVSWFIEEWLAEPMGTPTRNDVTLSQARVFVEPATEA